MSLDSIKILSGIGALLAAIGPLVPLMEMNAALYLAGLIAMLMGTYWLAELYNEERIFYNALYGFIFAVLGVIITMSFYAYALSGITWNVTQPRFFQFLNEISVIGWLIFVAFTIVASIFFKKAFTLLSYSSREEMFNTAGLILLIGAILMIFLIGAILLPVAWIMAAASFLSIKPPAATQ